MLRCITSCGPEGWKTYAPQFLETWPEIPITVYVEQEEKYPQRAHITYKSAWSVPHFMEWAEAAPDPDDWAHNMRKWCRKIWIILHCLENYDGEIWWIDADTEWSAAPKLEGLMEDKYIAWMERASMHPCTSVIGFNTLHEDNWRFINDYKETMLSGSVYRLDEWHDAYITKAIVDFNQIAVKNIAPPISPADVTAAFEGDAEGVRKINIFEATFPEGIHSKGPARKAA